MDDVRNPRFALVLAGALLGDPGAHAAPGDIVQDAENFSSAIAFFSPVGQTFTAERTAYTVFAFDYGDCNASSGPPEVRFELRQGAGTGGALLASQTRTDVADLSGWLDFGISGVEFTVGQAYTAIVSSPTVRGCYDENVLFIGGAGADYTGGAIVYQGAVNVERGDMRFAVLFIDDILADGFENP